MSLTKLLQANMNSVDILSKYNTELAVKMHALMLGTRGITRS